MFGKFSQRTTKESFSPTAKHSSPPSPLVVLTSSGYESGQKSLLSLADVLGRTAGVIAALRRRWAIWISCFRLCWTAFADFCCPLRHDGMSAAYCKARVTAGCSWPSAVQTTRRCTIPWARKSGISLRKWIVFRAKAACAASPRAAAAVPLKRPEPRCVQRQQRR